MAPGKWSWTSSGARRLLLALLLLSALRPGAGGQVRPGAAATAAAAAAAAGGAAAAAGSRAAADAATPSSSGRRLIVKLKGGSGKAAAAAALDAVGHGLTHVQHLDLIGAGVYTVAKGSSAAAKAEQLRKLPSEWGWGLAGMGALLWPALPAVMGEVWPTSPVNGSGGVAQAQAHHAAFPLVVPGAGAGSSSSRNPSRQSARRGSHPPTHPPPLLLLPHPPPTPADVAWAEADQLVQALGTLGDQGQLLASRQAEADVVYPKPIIPNDPLYKNQWSLPWISAPDVSGGVVSSSVVSGSVS